MLFKKIFAATLVVSLAVLSCKNSDDIPQDVLISFAATLNGVQEVPANSSTATGSSTASFNMTTKVLTVTTTHTLAAPAAGHIHIAAAGASGPVVFPFTTFTSPISFTTATALTATQEADLLNNLYYVNLHTAAFPGGEIRGQLIKAGTTADVVVTFTATLDGIQEVPANATTATGSATASYNMKNKVLNVITTHSLAATVTAGHIHLGAAGVSGAVVFPFVTLTSPINFTSATLTPAQEADLLNNLHYVNLHTAAFPGGEIRGQLLKAGTVPSNTVSFSGTLNGSQSTPANASTFTGTSTGTFNKTTKILTVTTTHNVAPAPTNGHIHLGAAGTAGPVHFPFTTFTSPINFTSAAPLTLAQEANLMNNLYYVNIHTALFPAGEIRAQLLKQ